MFDFPNSSAMDATASSGGPSTFLFQIVTGQPQQIAKHSTDMLTKATQFISMMDEFTKAAEQLGQVWSGQASQSAVKKITGTLQSFEKIIKVIQNVSKLVGVSGTLVQTAQTGYKTVVSAVNPTVASLMSNPWTYGAAVALSTATSASLRAFIMAIEGLLQGVGVAQLGAELAALAGIVMEIEQLAKGSGAGATAAGSVPTTGAISSTPITMPVTPPPVATAAGQQSITNPVTNYTPPALAGYTQPAAPGTGAGAALGQLNSYGVPGTSAANTPTANGSYPSGGAGNYPSLGNTGIPGTTGIGTPGINGATGIPGTMPGLTSNMDPSNSWIPVDPSSSTPATTPSTPTTAPVPNGQDVTVTTTDHGITTTVSVPAGQAADINLDMTVNNDHVSEHLNIGADGSVKVS